MSHHTRKPSLTARDHMIARHSRPSNFYRPLAPIIAPPENANSESKAMDTNTQSSGPIAPVDNNNTDGTATITFTSALDILTTEGEKINLHKVKHITDLAQAMEDMKRLDVEFGHTTPKSEAERELILQEMLPDFLPMRAVWKQEWNILRRRKAEQLRDRWEQGTRRKQDIPEQNFDLACEISKIKSAKKKKNAWHPVTRAVGYGVFVLVVVGIGTVAVMNYEHIIEVLENMEGMDFFL